MKTLQRASINAALEMGIKRIATSKQLTKAINTLMFKCEMPYYNKVNVVVDLDKDGNGQTTITAVPAANSRFATSFDYIEDTIQIDLEGYKVKTGGDTGHYVTTDAIYVSCKDCKDEMVTVIEQLKKYGLYRLGKDIFFPSYVEGQLEVRKGSIRGKVIEAEIINGNVKINDKFVTHYTFFDASPSQERVGDFMSIDETKYGLESKIAKASKVNKFNILDRMLGGSLSYIVNSGMMSLKDALKIGTRLALHNTAAVELGKVGNEKYGVLYIKNKITGADDYTEEMKSLLSELGINIDTEILDGQGWILAEMVFEMFKEAGVEISMKAIEGTGLQMRTEGINDKVHNLCINKKVRDLIVKYLMEVNKFKLDKKGNKTNEPGYVIVGNPNNIAYIVDSNGAKLPNFWRFNEVTALANGVEYGNFTMNILAVADDSSANTSVQALGKVINDAIMHSIAEKHNDMIVNSIERITKGNISIDGKCARAQKLYAANPDRSITSHVFHKLALGEISDQAITAIKRVKHPVDGLNLRAFFDNTFLLTGDIEQSIFKVREGGVVEAYSKSVVKKYRKELKAIYAAYLTQLSLIEEAVAIGEMSIEDSIIANTVAKAVRTNAVDELLNAYTVKYPCPTDIEFAKFRYLADFEVEEAIAELNTSNHIKAMLKDLILGLNDGVVMIAPLNTLKHKLAGMDTDFDGITSFFEKEIVKSAFNKDFNDVVYIDKKGDHSPFSPNYVAPVAEAEVNEYEF